MLKRLGSPSKGSRFAASSSSTKANAGKELSSLAAEAAPGNEGDTPHAATADATADGKASPDPDASANKSTSKKSKQTPSLPSLLKTGTTKPSAAATRMSLGLDLAAVAKADPTKELDTDAVDRSEKPGDANEGSSARRPPPLVRTPRQKSVFDDEGDAKPTSPAKRKEEQKPIKKPPSKRDSLLGLKNLIAKRDKSNNPRDEPNPEATSPEKKPDNSPKKKSKDAIPEVDDGGGRDAAKKRDHTPSVDAALSPIRRKHRPSMDGLVLSMAATPTIREATSLLARKNAITPGDGVPPIQQPEVHIVGEIVSGEGFGKRHDGYCCKWSVDYGNQWIHIAGDQLGQTQIDYSDACAPDEGVVVWSHPLDLHFATTALHGWPKLLLQVWRVDANMKTNVVGYGFVHLPFAPGHHRLTVSMWRPLGTSKEELEAALFGRTPELVTDEVLFNTAWAERCRLKTIATGRVHVEVGVIARNFHSVASQFDM